MWQAASVFGRSDGHLYGIFWSKCGEQAAYVLQAYPFIVRKVLRDAGPSSSLLLRDLVLDAGGSVRPARLSALLNAALGRVAARADGFVDFDAVPAESASLQVRFLDDRVHVYPTPLKRIVCLSTGRDGLCLSFQSSSSSSWRCAVH